MNNFVLEIWYDEGNRCTFYTVRKNIDDDKSSSETDYFFNLYTERANPFYENGLKLFRLITESIGNKYGAIDDFFNRKENRTQALPPKPKVKIKIEELKGFGFNFPLRLFCYRVSEQIVILFNGGIKDAQTTQESSLSLSFFEAQRYAKIIEDALNTRLLEISKDKRHLECLGQNTDIIL